MGEIERLCRDSRVSRGDVEALGELDESQYATLRGAFEHARDQREVELGAAIDNGLTMVPRFMRVAARRILFP
ncbi:hypothetical protein AB0N05_32335 [Nocardia sp. NPDC051030]|uniref:hypothetical protein n=1 Tax=Nocardia sp. NPDC051030 TaxID=3155162 RepID=UPI00342E9418